MMIERKKKYIYIYILLTVDSKHIITNYNYKCTRK